MLAVYNPEWKRTDAFQHINLILIRETDLDSLISSVSLALKRHRKYRDAEIVLTNSSRTGSKEKKDLKQAAQGESKKSRSGLDLSAPCLQDALKTESALLFQHHCLPCKTCSCLSCRRTWASIVVQLRYRKQIFGLLFVSIQEELVAVEFEQHFLEEMAENIAAGIYRITQDALFKKTATDLKKRAIELNYIYSFSRLIEKKDVSLEEILKGSMDLIPESLQYPFMACAAVFLNDTGAVFKTDNFRETSICLKKDILVNNTPIGSLMVCYLNVYENQDHLCPVFLNEEKELIQSIAVRLGKIIERKRDRLALEESEKRFRDLTAHAASGIAIFQDKKIVFNNPEFKNIFGSYSGDSFLFSHKKIHRDDVDNFKLFQEKMLGKDFISQDINFRICAQGITEKEQSIKAVFCRAAKTEFNGKDAVLLNLMDMTKPKELEHLLKIQDKMTSLGRVAAGIAHEIRNPLSGINIYLKALDKMYSSRQDMETGKKIVTQIQAASNKIEAVIKRVLDFSKPDTIQLTRLNINIPVQNALDLASVTLRKSNIIVEAALSDNLPLCHVDNHMIEQVLLNLFANALEAMKTIEKGRKKIILTTSYDKDNSVAIMVEDSGPGISESLHHKIFDPFYTTKNSSGIGLSICRRIIKDHSGRLEVSRSDVLGGAKFTILLPSKANG